MKLLLTAVLLVLAAFGLAAPSARSDVEAFDNAIFKLVRRDAISSCGDCDEPLDTCMTYATAHGITGCEHICMSHICRKWPDCRKCGEKFDHCTEREG